MNLLDPIETLKGVGPKTAEVLKKSGIKTVKDFLYNFPRNYENYQKPTKISEIQPGNVVIKGKIDSITTRRTKRRNFTVTEGIIRDSSDAIRVVWFNQPYRAKQFENGKEYYFTGTFDIKNGRYQLTSPTATLATDIDKNSAFKPIYVSHANLKSQDFCRLTEKSREKFVDIPNLIPGSTNYARQNAIFNIHFPRNEKDVESARKYLAYEELYELILAAKLNKIENQKLKSEKIPFDAEKIKTIISKLPFKLTNAQRLASWEIFQDLEKDIPMNRLLQGDVGAGKTMVAILAAYETAINKKQTAVLAPTAILAMQHYENFKKQLEPFGIKIELLTGATKHKDQIKKQIKNGDIDIVIGTHALLTDDTEFNNLALAIIDEQHRFGVNQRQKLLLKSPDNLAPHMLAMTATPIPRSLQLTVFGDLDVSILNELPKGRKPIETKIISEVNQKEILYPKIKETLSGKNQIYWICKTIDEGSNDSAISVKQRTKKLKEIFPNIKIEFLHGKMKQNEKDEIMEKFANGKIQILVSTTVVEVGVDVPNSTLIVIEDSENYGLAQLHQLRGRVGRGDKKSYCYLLTKGDNTPSRRLRELEKSTDGFYLAEVDLKIRGPGEIYGALQHGAMNLRIASLTDTKLITKARKSVDEFLQNPENMLKYKELMQNVKKYQQLTTLN